ncbi:MAG: helix-turn-helix domain-containing protein [Pseudomonadota bacterium]
MPSGDDLLSEREAAAMLGWSPKTLQRRRWQGEPPPFVKIGRTVRYRRRTLEGFIAAGERTSTADQAAA